MKNSEILKNDCKSVYRDIRYYMDFNNIQYDDFDKRIDDMSVGEIFEIYLKWNGIIRWGHEILYLLDCLHVLREDVKI